MSFFDKFKGNPEKKEQMKENQLRYFRNEKALMKFDYDMIKFCITYFEEQVKGASEEVLSGAPATFESNGKDHKGMLIATDERLYFVTSHLGFGQYNDSTEFHEITGIKTKAVKLLSKELTIETRHHLKVFKNILPGIGDNVINSIQSRNKDSKAPEVASTTGALSVADEIKKFKNLLDEGILTQEEFDAKKKELLGL